MAKKPYRRQPMGNRQALSIALMCVRDQATKTTRLHGHNDSLAVDLREATNKIREIINTTTIPPPRPGREVS